MYFSIRLNRIQDTTEEELPHLFDRYYRARQDAGKTGTGLGLSITKSIVEHNGGGIGVESKKGEGSTPIPPP